MGHFEKGRWIEYDPCDGCIVFGPVNEDKTKFIEGEVTIGKITGINLSGLKTIY